MRQVAKSLENSRQELLDLSTRNRLLSIPDESRSARVVRVVRESSAEVLRMLCLDKKELVFVASEEEAFRRRVDRAVKESPKNPASPEALKEKATDPAPKPRHFVDSKLHTMMAPEALDRRLLDLHRTSRTLLEEQGVNILYLALGQLTWLEAESSNLPRKAPLLLIPVELVRKTASDRFFLRWTGDDLEENMSLGVRLKTDFGIVMPALPDDDEIDLEAYFDEIRNQVRQQTGWEVQSDAIMLGFFSFAKFLMFRDLDPANWASPEHLLEHPLIVGLLRDGFPVSDFPVPENVHLDELISAERLDHVVDADGSQARAIEAVRRGTNLVIQGPPGTGKSQTITNIIATAVLDGKKVLFVAEKLAALEVVKRRLEKEGLGALCLELHSNRSNKRAVLAEIDQTWKLGEPVASGTAKVPSRLEEKRRILNRHVEALHASHPASGLSLFEVLGQMAALNGLPKLGPIEPFEGAEDWSPDRRRELRCLIEDAARRIAEIGPILEHPWRGTRLTSTFPMDLDRLHDAVDAAAEAIQRILRTVESLSEDLRLPSPRSLSETGVLARKVVAIASAPAFDRTLALASPWKSDSKTVAELVADGRRWTALRNELDPLVVDETWDRDLEPVRTSIAARASSWYRFFSGDYRRAVVTARAAFRNPMPAPNEGGLVLLDRVLEGQRLRRRLRSSASLGMEVFGSLWQGETSDWDRLGGIVDWMQTQRNSDLGEDVLSCFAALDVPISRLAPASASLGTMLEEVRLALGRVLEIIKLDPVEGLGGDDSMKLDVAILEGRFRDWRQGRGRLPEWIQFHRIRTEVRSTGMASLLQRLESGHIPINLAGTAHDRVYLGQILRELMRGRDHLQGFVGDLHQKRIDEFRALDLERRNVARYRVLDTHFRGIPRGASGVGAVGIVRSEIERKRGHRPVRKLLRDAGSVIQAIKPVFMMSPLSVAQFLEPGAVEFDLLVIDEASQVEPVDALGAIARSRQIVVVGDTRQLPPTGFFSRLTTNEAESEDPDEEVSMAGARDIESVLGLCRARGLPERLLRWHYRSRHQSLIAVSNREFYENQLFIVPSAEERNSGLGLDFKHVQDGVFDSGGSGNNRIEAAAVCQAIIEHALNNPRLSLGVASFSARQQQAILDELELLRRGNPDLEPYFAAHPYEPFFVKNLESVQGDERDVILISVGYGRNASGYMAMRFGPLGAEGGERRLNVLITRAKRRCLVFASITADDLDLDRAGGRGVAALKSFLRYAETGILGTPQLTGRGADSPFEISVLRAVESLGYTGDLQVGQSGFFIDIGVRDPDCRGRYLLGIECDGSSYHSSRSARDRDRLRQALLEDHGWKIHRIWSLDWFQDPDSQISRLEAVLRKARSSTPEPRRPLETPQQPVPEPIRRMDAPDPEAAAGDGSVPYEEAHLEVPRSKEREDITPKRMAEILKEILTVEAPMHRDELFLRIRNLWRKARITKAIEESVDAGLATLCGRDGLVEEEGFLRLPKTRIRVRNRAQVSSEELRKADGIPPAEIREAIRILLTGSHGISRDEFSSPVAQMFGLSHAGSVLKIAVQREILSLEKAGRVLEAGDRLKWVESEAAASKNLAGDGR
jgi:hypothetical protein